MTLQIGNTYTKATCDDPHQRGCTNSKEATATGAKGFSILEKHEWAVDDRTGTVICPACRKIPFGGDEISGKMTVEELLGSYERLCGRAAVEINRQADDPMADRTLRHMERYKGEILRRLRLIPKIMAADLQPK